MAAQKRHQKKRRLAVGPNLNKAQVNIPQNSIPNFISSKKVPGHITTHVLSGVWHRRLPKKTVTMN